VIKEGKPLSYASKQKNTRNEMHHQQKLHCFSGGEGTDEKTLSQLRGSTWLRGRTDPVHPLMQSGRGSTRRRKGGGLGSQTRNRQIDKSWTRTIGNVDFQQKLGRMKKGRRNTGRVNQALLGGSKTPKSSSKTGKGGAAKESRQESKASGH